MDENHIVGGQESADAIAKVEKKKNVDIDANDTVKYWKVTLDSTTGKTYYYNKKTKEVTWSNPNP